MLSGRSMQRTPIRDQKERLGAGFGSRQTNGIKKESPLTAQFMTGIN